LKACDNAVAERFVRTARAECLDWVLIRGERHLERALRTFVKHYNHERPHRGIDLEVPVPYLTHPVITGLSVHPGDGTMCRDNVAVVVRTADLQGC
jgi:hypothetical protein